MALAGPACVDQDREMAADNGDRDLPNEDLTNRADLEFGDVRRRHRYAAHFELVLTQTRPITSSPENGDNPAEIAERIRGLLRCPNPSTNVTESVFGTMVS
jgi:hypothetical protein